MKTDRRFREIIASVLAVDAESVADGDSPGTIPQWDSVNHLQLLLAIEEEFGIQFQPDEMAELSSVGRIRERLGDGIR